MREINDHFPLGPNFAQGVRSEFREFYMEAAEAAPFPDISEVTTDVYVGGAA